MDDAAVETLPDDPRLLKTILGKRLTRRDARIAALEQSHARRFAEPELIICSSSSS